MPPRTDAVDRTLAAASDRFATVLGTERFPRRDGFLQRVDPAVKLVGLITLVAIAATRSSPRHVAGLLALATALAWTSRVPLAVLGRRAGAVTVVSAAVVAPQLVLMGGPTVPGPIPLSVTGLEYVGTFVARVTASVSLALLITLTTRFADVLEALRRLRVPGVAVALLAITYRYLTLLLAELARTLRTRRGRRIAEPELRDVWRHGGATLGAFLVRTIERGERVQQAARARGGTGMTAYPRLTSFGGHDVAFAGVVVATLAVVIFA